MIEMTKLMELDDGIWSVSKTTDLVYSPDDNGYYFHEYKPGNGLKERVSIVYPTKHNALQAWGTDEVEWEKWY